MDLRDVDVGKNVNFLKYFVTDHISKIRNVHWDKKMLVICHQSFWHADVKIKREKEMSG